MRLYLAAELAPTFATEPGASGKRRVDDVKEAAESFAEPVESEIARLLRGIRKAGERLRGALEGREAARMTIRPRAPGSSAWAAGPCESSSSSSSASRTKNLSLTSAWDSTRNRMSSLTWRPTP
jgi:hypothetical protein